MKVLCVISLFLSAALLNGTEKLPLTLVRNGVPEAAIVLDHNPVKSAQLAAYELQHVLKLLTGAEIPIRRSVPSDSTVCLFVGDNPLARKLGIPGMDFQKEEYLIRFVGNRIFLMGNDMPDYGQVDYQNVKTFPGQTYYYRSTTYAVYDFLEKFCGVRFYGFGDGGIALRRRNTLDVIPADLRRAPAMDACRYPYFGSKLKSAGISERDAALLHFRWKGNVMYGKTNHSIYSIYWRYWGKAAAPSLARLFIEKRPEYFARGYEGKFAPSAIRRQYPDDPDLPPQLCTSNPGPVEFFAEEAFQVFRGKKIEGGYANVPRMKGQPFYYPLQEDDSGAWCTCPDCLKVAGKDHYNYRHFDWINRIAEAAAKKDPAVGISTLAYSSTLRLPSGMKLVPNIAVQICLGIQSWWHPGIWKLQHGAYKDWVRREGKKRPLLLWVYMLCPSHEAKVIYKYNKFFPVLYPRHTGKYFKEFAGDGIRGWFGEIDPQFHLLEAYVAAKISDDPDNDPERLLDEYFSLYYGNAGASMKEFYDKLERIVWNPRNYSPSVLTTMPQSSFTYGLHRERDNWHLGTPERIAELQKSIDRAVSAAVNPTEKARVKSFVDSIWTQTLEGRREFEKREKIRSVPIPAANASYSGERNGNPAEVDFDAMRKTEPWQTLDGKEIRNSPEMSIGADSSYLYLRYRETGDEAVSHKNLDIWSNGVEIFLADSREGEYLQIVLSPSGVMEAYRHAIVEGARRLIRLHRQFPVINSATKEGWTFSLAVPLESIPSKGIRSGGILYANFFRTKRFEGIVRSLAWSPIFSKEYRSGFYRMGSIQLPRPSRTGILDVNGTFRTVNDTTLPSGWIQNPGINFDKPGGISVSGTTLRMKSRGKWVHLYYGDRIFPANCGDKLIFEFTAGGSGSGSIGAYLYHARGNGAGTQLQSFPLRASPEKSRVVMELRDHIPERPVMGIRPVIAVPPESSLEISNLKVTLQSGK